jgi:hypothetical protein
MRAWKVETVRGDSFELERHLNMFQGRGFQVHTILPASFGFMIVMYMDSETVPSLPPMGR